MDGLDKRLATRYTGSKAVALNQDFWLSVQDVQELCPSCADKMAALRIRKIRASVLFYQDWSVLEPQIKTAMDIENLSEGWHPESRKRFWAALKASSKKCEVLAKGSVTDPFAFCAALEDVINNKGRVP